MAKIIYRGWIHGEENDADVLTSIGIKLGPWNQKIDAWSPCDVSEEAMEKLNGYWGKFIWSLSLVEV